MLRLFAPPVFISLATLLAVYAWGGFPALALACLLSVLEVTLSFDNAVVNAKVLAEMSPVWQRRFLTWGILFAVFGTRLVLPILIVAAAAALSPFAAAAIALSDPAHYAELLEEAGAAISAFGGAFLLMVSLKYFFDEAKEVHWLRLVERRLARWGRFEAIEIALVLLATLILGHLAETDAVPVFTAGILGIVVFVVMQGAASAVRLETRALAGSGAVLFLYLNILDSAFSLDGVVGAFAITKNLPVIVAGLGIGAFFVRTLTVFLVERKTLAALPYLEHGAHWAIFGLALSMFAELIVPVPEALTALVGFVFISLAYISSLRERRRSATAAV